MKSHNAKKSERGTIWDFSTSILSQNSEKFEGGPFMDNFLGKMSHNAEKTQRWDLLDSPGIVRAKKRKPFLILFARPNGSI